MHFDDVWIYHCRILYIFHRYDYRYCLRDENEEFIPPWPPHLAIIVYCLICPDGNQTRCCKGARTGNSSTSLLALIDTMFKLYAPWVCNIVVVLINKLLLSLRSDRHGKNAQIWRLFSKLKKHVHVSRSTRFDSDRLYPYPRIIPGQQYNTYIAKSTMILVIYIKNIIKQSTWHLHSLGDAFHIQFCPILHGKINYRDSSASLLEQTLSPH